MAYTTLQDEATLLAGLGVPVDVVATTVQGRPVRAVRLGSGPLLLLVTALQHGNEPPGRDGALAWLQELVANPPAVLDDWSIVVVPTVNPDGFVAGTRENAAGKDLNRDWMELSQRETRGLAPFVGERPLVVLDLHLGGTQPYEVGLQTAEMPGVHEVVVDRNDAVRDAIAAHMTTAGFNVGPWGGPVLETLLHFSAGLNNGVGLAAEIDNQPNEARKIAVALELCRAALAVAQAQASALVADRATADAIPITSLDVRHAVLDPAPAGYRLFHIPAHHIAAYGIGPVTALDRPVVGYALDPQAFYSLNAVPLDSLEVPAMRYSHTVTFTSGGTFTPAEHEGLVAVEVEAKAGSGGGAGAAATGVGQHSGGGGGGGGEYRSGWFTAEQLPASVAVTVGAGGAGGVTTGGNGGVTTFGSLMTCNAGVGGYHLPATTQAVGIISGAQGGWGGTGGDLSIPGGAGTNYTGTAAVACGGIGGSSAWGGGGRASTTDQHTPGRTQGGGGAGAANSQSKAAQDGKPGAPGAVRVHVYVAD